MINEKTGQRELTYVTRITEIRPIPNYDRVEHACIGAGWWVVVKKDEFKVGDLAVYFEIDSKLPAIPAFEFMEKYKYRVRTVKLCRVLSQGLIVHPKDLDLTDIKDGDFLTERLGVVYYEPEDNARKADSETLKKQKLEKAIERWKKRHPFKAKFKILVWLYTKKAKHQIYKSKKAKKSEWPAWVVKTDEERCQNMPEIFAPNMQVYETIPEEYKANWLSQAQAHRRDVEKDTWFATEKIDGTSTTFTMKQAKKKNRELIVCSRNVVFNNSDKKCFYDETDGNVYLEMADKYKMSDVLSFMLDALELERGYDGIKEPVEFITVQGETYGGSIQKRNYGPEHKLAIFNIIYKYANKAPVRMNPREMHNFIAAVNEDMKLETPLECVPIISEDFKIPETCDELIAIAHGTSAKDNELREGIVFRNKDATRSFKAVDPAFLEKFHG